MAAGIIACGIIGVYLVVATTILRLSTRMVAGIVPTFGSATGAIFTHSGHVVSINGTEFTVTKAQVVIRR